MQNKSSPDFIHKFKRLLIVDRPRANVCYNRTGSIIESILFSESAMSAHVHMQQIFESQNFMLESQRCLIFKFPFLLIIIVIIHVSIHPLHETFNSCLKEVLLRAKLQEKHCLAEQMARQISGVWQSHEVIQRNQQGRHRESNYQYKKN